MPIESDLDKLVLDDLVRMIIESYGPYIVFTKEYQDMLLSEEKEESDG